jgi:hypothetical protein
MPADFESSDTNWNDLGDTLTSIVQTSFEAVLAEIVDNSLDADSSRVHIEFSGFNKDEFAVIIYDNGKGFRTKLEQRENRPPSYEGLQNAFSLAGGMGMGGIGKFNIGLKITPLSKCESVFALCKLDDGNIIYRGMNKSMMAQNEAYGTFTSNPATKAIKTAELKLKSSQNDYRTAIILYDFKKMPIRGKSIIKDQDKGDLARFLMGYFGILYQILLEEVDAPVITIYNEAENWKVLPRDPFWADFTPDRIDERMGLDDSDPMFITEKERYQMECFKEWGTVKTEPQLFTIPIKNKKGVTEKHVVKITGYVIPANGLRGRIPDGKAKQKVMWSEPYKHNTSMKLVNMGGLYFYRNKRCICFGNTRTAGSNLGWYTLHEDPEGWLNKTRIKVEFTDGLDDWLEMSATKDSVDPDDIFFEKVLIALNQQIDDPQLRSNLGDSKPFFNRNCKRESDTVAALAQSPTSGDKKINKKCIHCGEGVHEKFKPYHHIDTTCPKMPCSICGGSCLVKCTYQCEHCPKIGDHHSKNCPLNCKYCDYETGKGGHKEGEYCPNLCSDCEKPKSLCTCPCPRGCGGTVTLDKCCLKCLKPKPCLCDKSTKASKVITQDDNTIRVEFHKGATNNEDVMIQLNQFLES